MRQHGGREKGPYPRFQIRDMTTALYQTREEEVASAGNSGHVYDQLAAPATPIQLQGDSSHVPLDLLGGTQSSISVSPGSTSDHRSLMYSDTDIHPASDGLNLDLGRQPQVISHTPSHTSPIAAMNTPASYTEDVAANLLSLRNAAHGEFPVLPTPGGLSISPSGIAQSNFFGDEDLFFPGSAYLDLHNMLRDHIIYIANSNAPTRDGTPDIDELACKQTPSIRPSITELEPQREYILWRNYVDEVAPWLDKFDNQRRFQLELPILAKTSPQLRYSILALSARQLERFDNSQSYSESLTLYQEAIHQLLPNLQDKDTSVIASCVVLCVLEMMSCNPKEWRRHLDGCASLMQSVGINGFSGGIGQALFWCFARMDVCGGLISEEETIIPPTYWASNLGLAQDLQIFHDVLNDFDMYANYAVYLCASVLKVYANRERLQTGANYKQVWEEKFRLLEEWYTRRPEQMKPLLVIPATEVRDSPFPNILYSNGSAVSGNQLHHTASVIMLQHKPKEVTLPKGTRSILWHARQICAISQANMHHGSWTNAVQPLWIAGKIMSHPSEHRAILDIYRRIEKLTGWGTKWRIDDLENYWGDLNDD
ncbi:hypothetical protein TWF281_005142 [Arthrobotrys megalospora]